MPEAKELVIEESHEQLLSDEALQNLIEEWLVPALVDKYLATFRDGAETHGGTATGHSGENLSDSNS